MLFLGDVIDPLALFPLVNGFLCAPLTTEEPARDEEFEPKEEVPVEARDVGPDGELELVPFILVVGPIVLDVGFLFNGMEEGDVGEGREGGIGWGSLLGLIEDAVTF